MITHQTEVLVAGLGPVGATAALSLARRGISVTAIEPLAHSATDLRASTYHAPTLEILDDLGAAGTLLSEGLKAPVYQYRDRQSGDVFAFDMTELSDHTRFPFRIQCEQHKVTSGIVEQLKGEPSATVLQGHRVLFVEQDDDGVTAYVENANSVERWRAKYLLATDGFWSCAHPQPWIARWPALMAQPAAAQALDALFTDYAANPPPQLHIDNLSAIVIRFVQPTARPQMTSNVDETALPTAPIPSHF